MINIFISTTGVTPSVSLNDLGQRVLVHPISNYNITSEFNYNSLLESIDFNNSLDNGYLTASINGIVISSSNGFSPIISSNLSNNITTSAITATSAIFTGVSTFSVANFNSIDTSVFSATSSIFRGSSTFSSAYFSNIDTLTIRSTFSTFNGFSTFSATASFINGGLFYKSPSNTFNYVLNTSEITANRNITLPLLTTDDTFVFQSFSQSVSNKTLLSTNNNIIDANRLQTFAVSNAVPFTNSQLTWNGSSWVPQSSIITLNGLTQSAQVISTVNDSNVTLGVVSTGLTHTFAVGWNSVLSQSRGGSGTSSTFSSGSILFSNGSTYNQNNSNLYWDNTNLRLGIGTSSPSASITTTRNIRSYGNYQLMNSEGTFYYSFTGSSIVANRNVVLPLLTTDDTFVFQSFSQSLTNKTLLSTNNNVIDANRLQTFTISTSVPSRGNSLVWNGSTWIPMTGATFSSSPVNPTTTTSITPVMMGLSGSITPIKTGTVLITITGDTGNSTNNRGTVVQIVTGTGSAPTNGVALTGTTRGVAINSTGGGTTRFPFSCTALVSGLNIGTQIWIDLSLAVTGGSGTARVRDIHITAIEY